ncbi:MAG: glycosyl transferase [Gaiellaceae bacterium]
MAHREFCTLFDSNYLIKALVLYRSLERHAPSFHLTAFCFDEEAKRLLDELALPHLTTVALEELEAFDQDLLSTKGDRTSVEYCWTATPALPLYVFGTRPEVDEVTYVDADLMFFSDPEALFDELGDASVLITPHRYSPEHAHHLINGVYNVQFLPFRRDERGLTVLNWWHDRCIEWCYYRLEDGKLGDQKYLDDWPERFPGVHVLQHKGGGLAPWNISQYDVHRAPDGRVLVDDDPLVFFHYHRVQLRRRGTPAWEPPGYPITDVQRELVYDPYLAALDEATAEVRALEPGFEAGFLPIPPLRERIQNARANLGARAVARFPFLLRVRHPLAGRHAS